MIERGKKVRGDERYGCEGLNASLAFFFFGSEADIHSALEKVSIFLLQVQSDQRYGSGKNE